MRLLLSYSLCFNVNRIIDGTQKLRTISADCSRAQTVQAVENELEHRFSLSCIPEPRESARFIIAHALGYKTVSMFMHLVKWHAK